MMRETIGLNENVVNRLLLFVALLSTPAWAFPATRIHYTTTIESSTAASPSVFTGVLTADGSRARIDYVSGRHPLLNPNTSIIVIEKGRVVRVLDHENRTWFERRTDVMSGALSTWRAPFQMSAGLATVFRKPEGRRAVRTIAGRAVTRHDLYCSYFISMEVAGERMQAQVDAHAEVWSGRMFSIPALPWGLDFALKSGNGSADGLLADMILHLGFPLELRVTVKRTIERGPETVETMTTKVESVAKVRKDRALFEPPPDYTYREPVLTVPEREGEGG